MKTATVIARAVREAGARFAFGHPGGEVVVLIDELRTAGLPFHLTHHENTAAFMALGYGELTGRPGVCVATLGPGATNMATGVASALLERAPVIALTGALATNAPRGMTHQLLDLNAFYRPIAKASIAVRADTVASQVGEALALACAERPGPVHLSLAADIAVSESTGPGDPQPSRPAPAPPDLAAGRRLLARAKRPVILAGVGALRPGADRSVARLAHHLGAPVAVTPKAKGLVGETDPFFAGVLEMAGDDILIEFLKQADLVIAVGLDVVELDKPWRFACPVLHIDGLPNADGYYEATVDISGPIAACVDGLVGDSLRPSWTADEIAAHRQRLRDHVRPVAARLQAWEVVDAVRAALPGPAIATSDVGAHKMLVGQTWRTDAPRTFFMANGLSSMGYAIPVAAAARLVRPDIPAVAFVGDGGLAMYLGELETLVRLRLDLVIVTFLDNSLELIKRSQRRRGVATEGTSFENPDVVGLARSFGARGYLVTSAAELAAAVTDASARPGVRLLGAVIDGADYRM